MIGLFYMPEGIYKFTFVFQDIVQNATFAATIKWSKRGRKSLAIHNLIQALIGENPQKAQYQDSPSLKRRKSSKQIKRRNI